MNRDQRLKEFVAEYISEKYNLPIKGIAECTTIENDVVITEMSFRQEICIKDLEKMFINKYQ